MKRSKRTGIGVLWGRLGGKKKKDILSSALFFGGMDDVHWTMMCTDRAKIERHYQNYDYGDEGNFLFSDLLSLCLLGFL